MPRNNSGGVGGMFDDLKSRLGFNHGDDKYDDYDDGYDRDYDDYGDDGYDDEYAGYGADYDENAPVGGFRPASTSSSYSSRSSRSSSRDLSSNLVSIDDVKASTRVPERLNRDPLAGKDEPYTTRPASSRNIIDQSSTASAATSSYGAGARDARTRSEGLDSLFEPSGNRSYDPYEAYSSTTTSAYAIARSMSVIKPVVYGDVERVARAVKSGDVVILAMKNTPDDLCKRILDFSFGVASALDASVECPGDKVFAIAKGNALSDAEKMSLRGQGVL